VLFGLPFARAVLDQVVSDLEAQIARARVGRYVVTLNIDILLTARSDPEHWAACRAAHLIVADGMPIVWASRLLGVGLPSRIAGADLALALVERAAARGHSVFLLGGRPEVGVRAATYLAKRWPALSIAGQVSPPFGFEDDVEANQRVVAAIRSARPQLLLVAFGAPKQEKWLHRHLSDCNVPVGVGVGGTFDFWAGTVRRAPRVLGSVGLEWLWRLAVEPRRLWRRYLIRDLGFVPLLLRELLKRGRGRQR